MRAIFATSVVVCARGGRRRQAGVVRGLDAGGSRREPAGLDRRLFQRARRGLAAAALRRAVELRCSRRADQDAGWCCRAEAAEPAALRARSQWTWLTIGLKLWAGRDKPGLPDGYNN